MRVFVAINPTEATRSRISEALQPLRDAGFPIRWVADENVHLTLKFLGEVSEERVEELCLATDTSTESVSSFAMDLRGFGAFPSAQRPSVVWTGVELDPILTELHDRTEAALGKLGYPRESRRFHPHLTVGRARKKTQPIEFEGLAEALERLQYSDNFRVYTVDVMRSVLTPTGAVYEIIHSAKLRS
jgi:2'-5' RNA ligase